MERKILKIGFQTEANRRIGMGHVMRCLALAKEFSARGHSVVFFTSSDLSKRSVWEKGFKVLKIEGKKEDNKTLEFEKRTQNTIQLLADNPLDVLIIDRYDVDSDYFINLRDMVRIVAYIDDFNAFPYPVDVVINGNITAQDLGYKKFYDHTKFLLGTKYNIKREEFKNLPRRTINKEVHSIMITTGGSDNYNVCRSLLNSINDEKLLEKVVLNVVLGAGFKNIEGMLKEYDKKNIRFYSSVFNKLYPGRIKDFKMSDLMMASNIAFSAGGSTLYELCACGTPSFSIILEQNQVLIAEKMHREGCVINLGWHNLLDYNFAKDKLLNLISDYEKRRAMSEKALKIADGNGTERIADFIENYIVEKGGGLL